MSNARQLGELVRIRTGKLDANASSPDGEYPFFTCSRDTLRISTYTYDTECVLVAGNGDLNVKYYKGKFDAYQRTYIVESLDEKVLNTRYLYWFLFKYVERLRELSIGGVIKYIKLKNLTDPLIPLPSIQKQKEVVRILDKAMLIGEKRKEASTLLDEYLRAIYFDILAGGKTKKSVTVESLATEHKGSMRTGPFGSDLRHSEFIDSGVAVIGIDNAVKNRFEWGKKRFISYEKYEKLKRYTVYPRDVIITIMGTTGRSAVIPDDIPLAINTKHLAAITFDESKANPYFMSYALHQDPRTKHQIAQKNKGAIMDGLNLGIIKSLEINLPPKEDQDRFEQMYHEVQRIRKQMTEQHMEIDKHFRAILHNTFNNKKPH